MPLVLSVAGNVFWGAGDPTQEAWEVFYQWTASLQSRSHHYANASETWTGLEISTDLRLAFMLIMANTETYSFQ